MPYSLCCVVLSFHYVNLKHEFKKWMNLIDLKPMMHLSAKTKTQTFQNNRALKRESGRQCLLGQHHRPLDLYRCTELWGFSLQTCSFCAWLVLQKSWPPSWLQWCLRQTGSSCRVSAIGTVFSWWQDNEIKLSGRPDLPKFSKVYLTVETDFSCFFSTKTGLDLRKLGFRSQFKLLL